MVHTAPVQPWAEWARLWCRGIRLPGSIVAATGLLLAGCPSHPDGLPGGKEEVLLPYPPDGSVVAWNGWAGEFVRDYCASCHNPAASCGGGAGQKCHSAGDPLIAPNFYLKSDVMAQATLIRCGIAVSQDPSWSCGKTTPKSFPVFLGDNPLPTDEQRDLLVGWIDGGMP